MKIDLLSAAHKPGLATLGANALVALAYTGTGLAGLRFEFFHFAVTTVWPPSGIALAAPLLFGLHLAPGVAIGAFAVSLSSSGSLIGALGVGVGNTLAAAAGALALTRFFRFDVRLARLRDMVALLLIGRCISNDCGNAGSPHVAGRRRNRFCAVRPRVVFMVARGCAWRHLVTPLILA